MPLLPPLVAGSSLACECFEAAVANSLDGEEALGVVLIIIAGKEGALFCDVNSAAATAATATTSDSDDSSSDGGIARQRGMGGREGCDEESRRNR